MAHDQKEIDSAIRIFQLATMGQPQAIQAIRDNYAHFAEVLPLVQQATKAQFQPGGAQLGDAEAVKAGIPADKLAEARQVQGANPADATSARYAQLLSLLAPKQIAMEDEVITASPAKPKPVAAKSAPKGAAGAPKPAPGAMPQMQLSLPGAAAGGEGPMQLKAPDLDAAMRQKLAAAPAAQPPAEVPMSMPDTEDGKIGASLIQFLDSISKQQKPKGK